VESQTKKKPLMPEQKDPEAVGVKYYGEVRCFGSRSRRALKLDLMGAAIACHLLSSESS
jgi:hypothetical protein